MKIDDKRYCEVKLQRVVRCSKAIQEKTKIGKIGKVIGSSESTPPTPASMLAEESSDIEKIKRKAAK